MVMRLISEEAFGQIEHALNTGAVLGKLVKGDETIYQMFVAAADLLRSAKLIDDEEIKEDKSR